MLALRGPRERSPVAPPPLPIDEARAAEEADRPITCAACGHAITRRGLRRSVEGAHVHARVNPSAIEYRFGCFDDAPGCRTWGETSDFFAWFPGYAWTIALCGACGVHLGWSFTREGDRFFGLVLERLHDPSTD